MKNKRKIVCLTSYSYNITSILDKYCDIILVGDSLANVLYGMGNTHSINLNTMMQHALSVKKKIKNSLFIIDLPKGTYRNPNTALKNSKFLIKKTGCHGVKIESNNKNYNIIKKLAKAKIPVMGHIGFTPQSKNKFKIHGRDAKSKNKLIKEAKKIEESGAFSIVLECISKTAAKSITNSLRIPTIGIGSSVYCDGQILVTDDIIGLSGFKPKFVKKYSDIYKLISLAVKRYAKDVKENKFPTNKNTFQ